MKNSVSKKIVFFHMLNDRSGSPNVLSMIIKGLIKKGYAVDLYCSPSENGFLSNIHGAEYKYVNYRFSSNKLFTLLLFIYAQARYFLAILKYRKEKDTQIYINTILPFGAALGSAFFKKKIIYHIHENPVTVNLIQSFSLYISKKTSDKNIFVSKYLYDSFDLPSNKKYLVYNALSPDFTEKIENNEGKKLNDTILMVCSLRVYKGVLIFWELAKKLPNYTFTLVLNASDQEISLFFNNSERPSNLQIFSAQSNLHPFYQQASLVLNLSIPNQWVETFGLTALEAMSYGIPVIVPPVGGIAEIIDDGYQGYKVDSRDIDLLINKITDILSNNTLFKKMSEEAKKRALTFSHENMVNDIERIINL